MAQAPVDHTTAARPRGQAGLPRGAHVLGLLPSTYPLRLVIGLTPRHPERLDELAARRSRTATPLSPARFAALAGPTEADQDAVISYLARFGLRVTHSYPDRLLFDATGTAGRVAAAFGTTILRYRSRDGQEHYANAAPPHLPAAIAPLISAVVGLRDDLGARYGPRPLVRPLGARAGLPINPPPPNLLTPSRIRAAYNVTPVYSPTITGAGGSPVTPAITGAGQTVALFELSPYDSADIAAYDAAFGLNAPPPIGVAVDGGATDAFGSVGANEAALDIELTRALAPGARILVYNGPGSPTSNDNTGVDDTYARIINDNQARILSTSWGQCEPDQQADQPPDLALLHNLFAQAVAEGMTVLAASGDAGANDCSDGRPNPSVDYPASDPSVVGVGGTTLTFDATGQARGEQSWPGSGGGVSSVFSRPSWQVGAGVSNTVSNGQRQVPDVAINAGAGYAVRVAGGWTTVNGTSAGPPLWAGLLALANETRYRVAEASAGLPAGGCGQPLGFGNLLPDLYALGPTTAFRDITSGPSNGVSAPGQGWDYVTGWGSPDAAALVSQLALRHPIHCAMANPTPSPTPPVPTTANTLTPPATSASVPPSSPIPTATDTPTPPALMAASTPPPPVTAIITPPTTATATTQQEGTATASSVGLPPSTPSATAPQGPATAAASAIPAGVTIPAQATRTPSAPRAIPTATRTPARVSPRRTVGCPSAMRRVIQLVKTKRGRRIILVRIARCVRPTPSQPHKRIAARGHPTTRTARSRTRARRVPPHVRRRGRYRVRRRHLNYEI